MNSMDSYSDVSLSSSEVSDVSESPIDDLSGIGPYSYEPDASNSSSSENESSDDDTRLINLDWFVELHSSSHIILITHYCCTCI